MSPAASTPPESRVSDFNRYKEAREGTRQRIPVEMPRVVVQEEPSAQEPAASEAEEAEATELPKDTTSGDTVGPVEG
jgi:hypothetical protein